MKKSLIYIAALFLLMLSNRPLYAEKGRYVVAVIPFSIHSAENIDYIRQGILDMLASRLSVSEKINVVAKDSVSALLKDTVGKELTPAEIYALGKKFNADFVVWGSLTKIGNSISIDGKLFDVPANKPAVNVSMPLNSIDDVIPNINNFAQSITTHILGEPVQTTVVQPVPKKTVVSQPSANRVSREAEIISGMGGGKKGTFTATINPYFINAAQPLNRKAFWKSQEFSNEFRGVDIGDVNEDKLNETVIIDSHNILIYQRKGKEFKLIQQIPGHAYDYYIGVDVADINDNGIKEIIVSSYNGQIVDSFVIEFRNGKFEMIASDLPWFMRVIDGGSSARPRLLGQRRGLGMPFDTQIYEIVWRNGQYVEGPKMKIPQGLSVYGLTLDRLGSSGAEKIIALDKDDYINIIEQTDKPLSKVMVFGGSQTLVWRSDDYFGGSNLYVEPISESATQSSEDLEEVYYINLRILSYDTNKDGKSEILIVKNLSASSRLLQRLKLFTNGEIYNLQWDGMGMTENWHTKKISGYVADIQLKDIDNDGENEIVLALVISVGASIRERSVIVAYSIQGE